jgi:uncharacterized membrane protein
MLADMPHWLINTLSPVNRWVHMVASTLLVGGVLFFEFVVPLATTDLRNEQRMAVFGRARWVFRGVALLSIALLVLSGSISSWQLWPMYGQLDAFTGGWHYGPKPWLVGHIAVGLVGFVIVLRVTNTTRVAPRPVGWLRALLVVLLVSMFFASIARHVRLRVDALRLSPQSQAPAWQEE